MRARMLVALATLPLLLAALPAGAQIVPVNFHWSPPTGGARVDHYEVYYTRDGGPPVFAGTRPDTVYVLEADYGVRYRVSVCGVSATGLRGEMSDYSEQVYFALPIESESVPNAPALRPNFPNPFNPETTIRYGVSESAAGSPGMLEIYNIRGRRVRIFTAETSPGWHSVVWNGQDESGAIQPSGTYFLRYSCQGHSTTWKMSMVK